MGISYSKSMYMFNYALYTAAISNASHKYVQQKIQNSYNLVLIVSPSNIRKAYNDDMPIFKNAINDTRNVYLNGSTPVIIAETLKLLDVINSFDQRVTHFHVNSNLIENMKNIVDTTFSDDSVNKMFSSPASLKNFNITKNLVCSFIEHCNNFKGTTYYEWRKHTCMLTGVLGPGDLHVKKIFQLFDLNEKEAEQIVENSPYWKIANMLSVLILTGFSNVPGMNQIISMIYLMEADSVIQNLSLPEVLINFRTRLVHNKFDGLVLPKKYIHSSSLGDIICWKLLHHLHYHNGTLWRFQPIVTLPKLSCSTEYIKWATFTIGNNIKNTSFIFED